MLALLAVLAIQANVFRVLNNTGSTRTQYVTACLPFAQGQLLPTGSVQIGASLNPFRPLEKWADGSVRRAQVNFLGTWTPWQEQVYTYAGSPAPPDVVVGGPTPPLMQIVITLGGNTYTFNQPSWTALPSVGPRSDRYASWFLTPTFPDVRVHLYATSWNNQLFGRLSVVLGVDALTRPVATAVTIGEVRVRFLNLPTGNTGAFWPATHGVSLMPSPPAAPNEWRILPATDPGSNPPNQDTKIGDAQQWGTMFLWALAGADLTSAAAELAYPLVGMPDPQAEDVADAYGLFGSLCGSQHPTGAVLWPATNPAAPQQSRLYWENEANTWLQQAFSGPWHNGGNFFYTDEESGSVHEEWGLAPWGQYDKAGSPRGVNKGWALAYVSLKKTDAFGGGKGDADRLRYPNSPSVGCSSTPCQCSTGCTGGWCNDPIRPAGGFTDHTDGGNGWVRRAETHHEENLTHRIYQLTGDYVLYDRLYTCGQLACYHECPYTGNGNGFNGDEGRGFGRPLQRRLIAWLIGDTTDRESLDEHWQAWCPKLQYFPILSGSSPPVHVFTIHEPQVCPSSPGDGKLPCNCNTGTFLCGLGCCPPSGAMTEFEEYPVGVTLERAIELLVPPGTPAPSCIVSATNWASEIFEVATLQGASPNPFGLARFVLPPCVGSGPVAICDFNTNPVTHYGSLWESTHHTPVPLLLPNSEWLRDLILVNNQNSTDWGVQRWLQVHDP